MLISAQKRAIRFFILSSTVLYEKSAPFMPSKSPVLLAKQGVVFIKFFIYANIIVKSIYKSGIVKTERIVLPSV